MSVYLQPIQKIFRLTLFMRTRIQAAIMQFIIQVCFWLNILSNTRLSLTKEQ